MPNSNLVSKNRFKGLIHSNVAAMCSWNSHAIAQFSLHEQTSGFITSFNNKGLDRINCFPIRPRDAAQSCIEKIACSPVATTFVTKGAASSKSPT